MAFVPKSDLSSYLARLTVIIRLIIAWVEIWWHVPKCYVTVTISRENRSLTARHRHDRTSVTSQGLGRFMFRLLILECSIKIPNFKCTVLTCGYELSRPSKVYCPYSVHMRLQNTLRPKLYLSLRRQQSGACRLVLMQFIYRLQHLKRVIALTTHLRILTILVETIGGACMLSGNKFFWLLISDPFTSLHHLFLIEWLDLVVGLNDGIGPLVILRLAECLWLHFEFALIHFYALELLVVHSVYTLLLRWDHTGEVAAALWLSDWFLY